MKSNTGARRKAARQQQRQRQTRVITIAVVSLIIIGTLFNTLVRSQTPATNMEPFSTSASVVQSQADTNGVVITLLAPDSITREQSVNPRLEYDPVLGDPSAPIKIIEYGAYGCSSCRTWHQAGIIEQILDLYKGQVQFTFRDFPVISPAYDQMAAEAAQCVLDVGQDTFWAFHHLLYTQVNVGATLDNIADLGVQVGVDPATIRQCVHSGTHSETVRHDLDRALRLGLRGTPIFFVNDVPVYYASPENLQAAIAQAIKNE